MEIIQGKITVAEVSRTCDLTKSEIETWIDDAKKGMVNSLYATPQDIHAKNEKQLKDLQEAMLELRARKKFLALMARH